MNKHINRGTNPFANRRLLIIKRNKLEYKEKLFNFGLTIITFILSIPVTTNWIDNLLYKTDKKAKIAFPKNIKVVNNGYNSYIVNSNNKYIGSISNFASDHDLILVMLTFLFVFFTIMLGISIYYFNKKIKELDLIINMSTLIK